MVDVACGADHTIALADTGDVWVWGRGHEGQLLGPGSKPLLLAPQRSEKLSTNENETVQVPSRLGAGASKALCELWSGCSCGRRLQLCVYQECTRWESSKEVYRQMPGQHLATNGA